jgi:hypothetical protein
MTDLVDMIKNRIARVSIDARYGCPMSWDEAEKLLDIIDKLQAEVERLEDFIEEILPKED